jgi:hypothetical protein
MNDATHTITTTKGGLTGTLAEVCGWQAEHQGAVAEIDGVDVSDVDFDAEELAPAIRAVRVLLACSGRQAEDCECVTDEPRVVAEITDREGGSSILRLCPDCIALAREDWTGSCASVRILDGAAS